MRRELEGFMASHPVHPRANWFARFSPALAMLLLVGSSVSLAARGALPGDLLYPVKVGLNENVQKLFAPSAGEKAELETSLAGKRIEEARTLKATGKLDAQTEADITIEASKHIEAAQKSIVELKAAGDTQTAAQASVNFQTVVGIEATSSPAQVQTQINESVNSSLPPSSLPLSH